VGREVRALLGFLIAAWLAGPALAQEGGMGVPAPAGSAPPLSVSRHAVTILEVDEDARTVSVLERYQLVNGGEETFVPSTTGSQGPMGLLRFGLPRGAFDLTLDQQLAAHEIIQVDRGFASLMPLPPGQTDVTYSYRLPYARDTLDLVATAVYPTAALWVLAPADLAVSGSNLQTDRVVDIGRQRYQLLAASDLAAGQRVTISVGGLPYTPRPWLLDETVQRAGAAALALLGVAAAALYAWRRPLLSERAEGVP
jgi:hypothetical protein